MTAVDMQASVRIGLESAANLRYPELLRRSRDRELPAALGIVDAVGRGHRFVELPVPPGGSAVADRKRVAVSRMRATIDVGSAGLRVLVAVQNALRPLEGTRLYGGHRTSDQSPTPGALWRQLATARANAIAVLVVAEGSLAAAKRAQLDTTPRPLTVCGECGLVFADSTSSRGPSPFRSTCDGCRPKSLARRAADGERRRRAWEHELEEIAPGVWL